MNLIQQQSLLVGETRLHLNYESSFILSFFKMPEKHFSENRKNLRIYAIMKLEYEASMPFMMALALGLTLKGTLKVQFRLISPLMKSGVVLDSLQWNIKWDETHLVLYSWEMEYLVSYQFCELQGLKLREGKIDTFVQNENLCSHQNTL